MLKPLGDRVVLQVEEAPEQSVGGILLAVIIPMFSMYQDII